MNFNELDIQDIIRESLALNVMLSMRCYFMLQIGNIICSTVCKYHDLKKKSIKWRNTEFSRNQHSSRKQLVGRTYMCAVNYL